tara:strand:+ start:208 stop:972 length:765 start_codon:yes stop_codon:yes gene_type:complete
MCIVMLKKEKAEVSKKQLEKSFSNNPDGSGYLFARNGNLTIKKGFFTFNEFYDSYSRDMAQFNNPIAIIHFRITTHGLTNKTNCHPHMINDGIGFAHNGIIDFVNDHKKKSDTLVFRNDVLRGMPNGFMFNDSIMALIEESIGNSKLVFLDRNGNWTIANEYKGHWNKKSTIWYSNKSYCEIKQVKYYNPYVYGYQDYDDLNITHKRKTIKKANNIERTQCRTCYSGLMTLSERNVGHCQACQMDGVAGSPKRI